MNSCSNWIIKILQPTQLYDRGVTSLSNLVFSALVAKKERNNTVHYHFKETAGADVSATAFISTTQTGIGPKNFAKTFFTLSFSDISSNTHFATSFIEAPAVGSVVKMKSRFIFEINLGGVFMVTSSWYLRDSHHSIYVISYSTYTEIIFSKCEQTSRYHTLS